MEINPHRILGTGLFSIVYAISTTQVVKVFRSDEVLLKKLHLDAGTKKMLDSLHITVSEFLAIDEIFGTVAPRTLPVLDVVLVSNNSNSGLPSRIGLVKPRVKVLKHLSKYEEEEFEEEAELMGWWDAKPSNCYRNAEGELCLADTQTEVIAELLWSHRLIQPLDPPFSISP